MTLSGKQIKSLSHPSNICEGDELISPFQGENLQPASYDLTLGLEQAILKTGNRGILTLDDAPEYETFRREAFYINPKQFVLANTIEMLNIPSDMSARVEGRSSLGRLGLFIQNAGWVDPGFRGQLTLELYNANDIPILLQAGRRICQVVFSMLDDHDDEFGSKVRYSGKYQNQEGVVGSRIYLDTEADAKKGTQE